MAVGSSTERTGVTVPLAERWDGSRWSTVRTRAGGTSVSYLSGVSCPSRSNCIAVGYAGNAAGTAGALLAERFNGVSWVVQRTARPSGAAAAFLSGVSCMSSRSCVAVGFWVGGDEVARPLAERWDGERWSIERVPRPQAATEVQLAGVSCALRGPCMAAGFFGIDTGIQIMLAEQRSGGSWSTERTLYPRGARGVQFAGVSCASPRSCAAVGSFVDVAGLDEALVERFNGVDWAIQPAPLRPGDMSNSLSGVSCTTSRTCTAVGSSVTSRGTEVTLAERYS